MFRLVRVVPVRNQEGQTMPIMTYRNDDERGETFIRSADFVESADDALRAIECAKIRAEREIIAAITRLRDICNRQLDNVGAGNTATDNAISDQFVDLTNQAVDMVVEMACHAESAIHAEMEG
jgi:hypothetical protein